MHVFAYNVWKYVVCLFFMKHKNCILYANRNPVFYSLIYRWMPNSLLMFNMLFHNKFTFIHNSLVKHTYIWFNVISSFLHIWCSMEPLLQACMLRGMCVCVFATKCETDFNLDKTKETISNSISSAYRNVARIASYRILYVDQIIMKRQ